LIPASARPFTRTTVIGIVALAAGSFALGIVFTAFSENLGDPYSPGSDLFSTSALGHRAAAELLRRSGVPVFIRRTGWPGPLGSGTPLVIAEPSPGAAEKAKEDDEDNPPALASLMEMARLSGAPVLLVLPKWSGVTDPERPRWIEAVQPRPDSEIREVLSGLRSKKEKVDLSPGPPADWDAECEVTRGAPVRVVLKKARFLQAGEDLDPIVSCGGRILAARLPGSKSRPEVYLLSDPDVMNNQGLSRGENARLFRDLLLGRLGARSVVWDETHHGFQRVGGFLREMFRFPLALLVAQALLTAGIVLWAGTGRFGEPVTPPSAMEGGKRGLIDNIAKLLSMTEDAAPALSRYFELTMRAAAAFYFLPAELPEREVVSRLQAIGRSRGIDFDLEGAWRAVRESPPAPEGGPREALDLARQLHRWREAMTDVH
jgi:hypothetical protein